MAFLKSRAVSGAHMNPTTEAALFTGLGVAMLGGIVALVLLLLRAKRNHKRLLADLEERGVVIAQSQRDAKRESITRPRAVLRRNTILPFNAKSGWGTLPSIESINPSEPPSIPPHYVPPKPAGFVSRSSRLSWPFSARRASGRNIHLRKIRVPILHTVIESPKPSPLVPVLSGSLGGDPSSPGKSRSRPSSDQSLLQRHPAFRITWQEGDSENNTTAPSEPLRRSLTAKPVAKTDLRVRPNRSRSVAEIPMSTASGAMSQLPRPKLHARSASMCSQSSGNAPDAAVPPLPLEVARIKSGSQRHSLLSRSPSRMSVSSFESVGSSILATQSCPILPRSTNVRVQKVTTKRDWRNSMIVGPRPIRDTLTLHGKNQRSQSSIKSSAARFSSVTPTTRAESRSSKITGPSSMQSIKVKTAETVTLSKVSSPSCSPLTVRSMTTPRRKSGIYVTAYGSPEERQKGSYSLLSMSGNHGGPQRQLSQASTQASSTRSSNGNPFQWDHAPLSSAKPSALKGSPSARKGHRRQNCVRISLVPTTLGPPPASRSPSPSFMNDIPEESPNTTTTEKRNSVGLGFSNTRSLPRPPSSSTFAPDVKIYATSIRASLTPSSPTLSMANYDHGPIESPLAFDAAPVLPHFSSKGINRLSTGSVFSVSAFPSPCHGTDSIHTIASPPTFALSLPSNEYAEELRTPDSPFGPSSPLDVVLPDGIDRPFYTDEYDPERPYLVYQTPTNSPAARNFSSPFSTIPEESSVSSSRTVDYEHLRSEDSPPLSPKSLPQHTVPGAGQESAYNLPIKDTIIPEEYTLDCIDPAILSNDAFTMLNSSFDRKNTSIMSPSNNNRYSILMPNSPKSARSMFEPLLEAAFPSSPPIMTCIDASPSLKRARSDTHFGRDSSPSSMYSSATPVSSPPIAQAPCSPQPQHATLPTPALNFSAMPMLSPNVSGPRGKPPSPLRSSIQKLRRMNSDAEKDGRGERRYLRLGREDSIALPGEESWLEDLSGLEDETADDEEWDDEKGRRLVGDLLEDREGVAMIMDLAEWCQTPTPTRPTSTADDSETMPTTTGAQQRKSSGTQSPRKPEARSPGIGDRSSSIWEDGEKFWASTPPHLPNSPNKPKQRFLPLLSSQTSNKPIQTPNCKREFEVAKDDAKEDTHKDKRREGDAMEGEGNGDNGRKRKSTRRYRKRSALGIGTPNVSSLRIQVCPPTSVGGTPGSLYDADGFLR